MKKIGILGIGLMGKEMAFKLLENNYNIIAYNRSEEKLLPLKNEGIMTTTDEEYAINESDCLILMLSDAQVIAKVILSSQPNLKDKTIIQMSTISPSESQEIKTKVNNLGGEYFEASVLGSIPEVKSGKLLVMVGANQSQFEEFNPLLKVFCANPVLIGEVGTASTLKLALNQLIAGLTTSFALSLSLIQKQNVDVNKFMEILRESALYAPTFDKKLDRMLDQNYENPNFPTKHLLKDVNLFLTEATDLKLNTSALEGIQKILLKTLELGLENSDYSSLFAALKQE